MIRTPDFIKCYKAACRNKRRKKAYKVFLRALPILLLLICFACITLVLVITENNRERELGELEAYVNDPSNSTLFDEAVFLMYETERLNLVLESDNYVIESILSYPIPNREFIETVKKISDDKGLMFSFNSYSSVDGILSFEVKSETAWNINDYVKELSSSGLFQKVKYTGYSLGNGAYAIRLVCVLPAGGKTDG